MRNLSERLSLHMLLYLLFVRLLYAKSLIHITLFFINTHITKTITYLLNNNHFIPTYNRGIKAYIWCTCIE